MINLPTYRAKKIDSDEYVEGFYIPYSDRECYIGHRDIVCISNRLASEDKIDVRAVKCDMTTLSIHFPDMLDSQGNKIFASLQEDGKGGDITDKGICMYISKYHQFRIITNIETFNWLEITRKDLDNYSLKIIGIQQ